MIFMYIIRRTLRKILMNFYGDFSITLRIIIVHFYEDFREDFQENNWGHLDIF